MRITVFDLANIILGEATKRFEPGYCVSEERLSAFKRNCELVDGLLDMFDATGAEVKVDEETKHVMLIIRSPDLIADNGREHEFFKYVSSGAVYSVSFRQEKDELLTSIEVDGIWEAKNEQGS